MAKLSERAAATARAFLISETPRERLWYLPLPAPSYALETLGPKLKMRRGKHLPQVVSIEAVPGVRRALEARFPGAGLVPFSAEEFEAERGCLRPQRKRARHD